MYNKFFLIFLVLIMFSCKTKVTEYELLKSTYKKKSSQWPKPWIDSSIVWKELSSIPKPNYPNKTPSKELIKLGEKLFFDHRISQTKQIACASCHHPDQNFTDNRKVSMGFELKQGKRNAPTVVNLSYSKNLFWDGRANSLEKQALEPMQNPIEMNTSLDTVLSRVIAIKGYKKSFRKVLNKTEIKIEDIAYAIASYERSLVSRKSKFDYFLEGKRELNSSELKGLHLFRTKARCMNCHNGPNFSDDNFHNIGLTYYGRKYEDLGRYNVTKKAEDVGRFRTPSLRDVMRTRPWMHNGLFDKMDGILNMYNAGMPRPKRRANQLNDSLFPITSPLLKKLNLTPEEKQNIIAFLQTISAPSVRLNKVILPK